MDCIYLSTAMSRIEKEEKNMQDACVWTVYLSTAMSRIEKEEKNM